MKALSHVVFGVILVLVFSTLANAGDYRFTAKYGGSLFKPAATIETQGIIAGFGGSQFLALEIEGPEVLWRLRPSLSYARHWAGPFRENSFSTQSNIYSFGFSETFAIGKAGATIFAGTAYFNDKYCNEFFSAIPSELIADSWGVDLGLDLQFNFFDSVNMVVGYKFLKRPSPVFEGSLEFGNQYRVEGQSIEHCVSVGVSLLIGGA